MTGTQKVDVVFQSYHEATPNKGYWDYSLFCDLIDGSLWRPVGKHEFVAHDSIDEVGEDAKFVIFVLPARYHANDLGLINRDLARFDGVLVVLLGDEEGFFPWSELTHPNMRLWIMSPRKNRNYPEGTRFLGTGFPPQARPELAKLDGRDRPLDHFFAGQITHQRRLEMARALQNDYQGSGGFHPSKGFTQGLPHDEYYRGLASAKIAICPSGPVTPDTFRLFEGLEAGCIPMADCRVPSDRDNSDFGDDYWTWFFGEEPPFPVLTDYEQLAGYTADTLKQGLPLRNKVFAWWLGKKREMAYNLEADLTALGVPQREEGTYPPIADMTTVIVPTSPIQAHPSTEMIEQTIRDVRTQLPDCEIIIMVDGVRAEQEDRRADYEEYTNRLLWLAHHTWSNVLVVIHKEHQHQARMTRDVLHLVKTPTILFVEHDAPITPDCDFDWRELINAIMYGQANVIRFHHEALVLPEHEYLMLGAIENVGMLGLNGMNVAVPMRKTYQWSSRPHLASTAFYRQMLTNYFHPESRTMIEDVMHGALIQAVDKDGIMGWHNFRLWMYTPEGNIKRSFHLDGRGQDPVYPMTIKAVTPENQ